MTGRRGSAVRHAHLPVRRAAALPLRSIAIPKVFELFFSLWFFWLVLETHPSAKRFLAAAARTARLLGGMPLLLAIAGGAGAYGLTHRHLLSRLVTNDVSHAHRLVAVAYLAVAFVAIAAVYLFAARKLRERDGAAPPPAAFRPLREWMSFLLASPFAAVLLTPDIESDSPITTSLLILAASLLVVPTLRKIAGLGARGAGAPPGLLERHLPLVIALALGAAYAVVVSVYAINNYHALKTRTWDLAIYANVMYQSSHGVPMGCSIMEGGYHNSAHFDPILLLLALFYRLYPHTEYLLVAQSVWCALGVLPAFLLGRHHLRSAWAGTAMAAVWVLNPALQGANLLDFHSLTLVATPLLLALYFLETGRTKAYLATLAILLLIREDVSLMMSLVGVALIIDRERRTARLGALTILVSLAYVIVAKLLFMNASGVFNEGDDSYGYSYYFTFMIPNKLGLTDYLITLATNPVHTLLQALSAEKIDFVLKMLAPLLFLPLVAPRWRILLLYGVVSILFSSREYMYTIHYQYPMPILPTLVALAPAGIRRLEDRGLLAMPPLGRAGALGVAGGVLFASLLACLKLGALPTNGEFFKIYRSLDAEQAERHAAVERMAARIPEDASVQASLSVCAYVANRRDLFVLAFRKPERPVDFLLINSRDLKKKFEHLKGVYAEKERSGELVVIDSHGTIKLYGNTKSARWRRD